MKSKESVTSLRLQTRKEVPKSRYKDLDSTAIDLIHNPQKSTNKKDQKNIRGINFKTPDDIYFFYSLINNYQKSLLYTKF